MKHLFPTTSLLSALLLATACSNGDADVRPGLWAASDVIETFPGDTVLVTGQASNYVGLRSLQILCEAWGVSKTYALDGEHTKVFNYNYQLVVPSDATFDQELKLCLTDTEGTESKRTIALTFKPDTEAPQLATALPSEVSVDYDTSKRSGTYQLDLTVTDDRQLRRAFVTVPSLGVSDTIALQGRRASLQNDIEIASVGSFPMTLTLEDASGNQSVSLSRIVVMMAEEEDPIDDYPQMYLVNASEQPSDYIYGYYRYMDRSDACQYTCKIYAPTDGYQVYFTPTQSLGGDLYGVSPYVSSKLLNRNGYVLPVTIEKKGYYYVWLDLQNHQYSLTPYEVDASTYKGDMVVTGTGFASMADWTFSSVMQQAGNDYRRTIILQLQSGYSGDYTYCVTDGTSAWSKVWRCTENKWWWLDDANYGGSVATFAPGDAATVEVTFDTAELWSTMKKAN